MTYPMTYQAALRYLRDLEPRGWRMGLDRMQEFVRRAGLSAFVGDAGGPQFIHVAGTNGKGSVTAFLQSMMRASGHKTGAFFSPYVVEPRERVWFDDHMISESEFAHLVECLIPISESMDETEFAGVTEFEFKTAIGFEYWRRCGAEWVALEVGLGGRLDSTNVVTPRASIIVSIGLDHVQILGDTYAKIAYEKAGIIKNGVPVIVGALPAEAEAVVLEVAEQRNAPVWLFGRDFRLETGAPGEFRLALGDSEQTIRPSLFGDFQGHNAALAYVAMEVSGAGQGAAIAEAAARAFVPGRFQIASLHGRTIVLDGAHNAEAAASLARSLDQYRRSRSLQKVILVAGMLSGHDPKPFFAPLASMAQEVHLAPIDFHRALSPELLREQLEGLIAEPHVHDSVSAALAAALKSATESDLVLVTGSFYLVGESLRALSALGKGPQ